ncbi:MAG: cyclic nucleotide-binding domain-containing protein [Gammaproteobacteria bacterium]
MTSILESPDLSPEEVAARLLVTPSALDDLTLRDAVKIVGYMRPKTFAAGTVFIREGEVRRNDYMLLVLEGEISVDSASQGEGDPLVYQVMAPGALIGEMGMLDGGPRSANCTAVTDVTAAILTRTALMRLLKDDPQVGARLLLAITKRMSDHLRETTRKLRTFAQMNKALQEELTIVMNNRVSPGGLSGR